MNNSSTDFLNYFKTTFQLFVEETCIAKHDEQRAYNRRRVWMQEKMYGETTSKYLPHVFGVYASTWTFLKVQRKKMHQNISTCEVK